VLESSPVPQRRDQGRREIRPKPTSENWEERQAWSPGRAAIAPNETLKFSVSYAIGYRRTARWSGFLEAL